MTEWKEFGMTKSTEFFRQTIDELQNVYDTLTNKSYQLITLAGVLVGLIFSSLSSLSDFGLFDGEWYTYLLLVLLILGLLISSILSLMVVLPKSWDVVNLNDKLWDRMRYEADEKIADIILSSYKKSFEKRSPIVNEMGIKVKFAWISMLVSIILIVIIILILIF